jgi:hypothetical protein
MTRLVFAGGLVFLSVCGTAAAACSGSPAHSSGGEAGVDDAGGDASLGPPTFTNVYNEILGTQTCGATGLLNCHGNPEGGVQDGVLPNSSLDFSSKETAYTALYNMKALGSLVSGETGEVCGATPGTDAQVYIRVVPDNAQDSLLYEKVEDPPNDPSYTPPCGNRMPLNHDDAGVKLTAPYHPLSQAQISLIEDWINAGALNN